MEITDNVYIAEYGTHSVRMRNPFISAPVTNVLIVAKNYRDAALKAERYLEVLKEEDKKNVLEFDGSLKSNIANEGEIKLISLGVGDMKIIW